VFHAGYSGECDQCDQQRVFDQVLAILAVEQYLQPYIKAKKEVVHLTSPSFGLSYEIDSKLISY